MHFNHWLFKLPFFREYEAITLPWGVYFRDSREDTDPTTIMHEQVHIWQREKMGMIRFYLDYMCQFMRGLAQGRTWDEAYRCITYEEVAYVLEEAVRQSRR